MRGSDRTRAKAAFEATRGQEMDASWSEFISRAVMNEVLRRERVYNEGNPFPGGTRNLAPGRKLAP
ncbi:ParB family protein [Paenarthrobacter ureafaciens]|uniref:ParB family protein n=1 Tax=Paenarthrobacter ureafaciens TaxID=37931 RepID=UPI0035565687